MAIVIIVLQHLNNFFRPKRSIYDGMTKEQFARMLGL